MLFELVILYLVTIIASGLALLVDSYRNGHTKGEFAVLFIGAFVPVVNIILLLISMTSIFHPKQEDVEKSVRYWY